MLTFGCGGGSDPDSDPELTIRVQPPVESPFPGGIFVGGQNVMLVATVSHAGGPSSEATQLQLYLSQDAAISTDDLPRGEMQPVEALMPGASAEVTLTVTLPPMTGSYYYGACITNSNENCSSGVELMVSELAQAVEPGSMTEASLTAGGTDYFQFTLESAQFLDIYSSGGTDVTGRLYDARGMLLVIDENRGDGNNFRIDRPLDSGTYFVRVSGNDMSTSGGYTLNLEGSGVTTVMPGSMTEATLPAGGAGYFQFTLESAQVSVIYSSGTTDVIGRLYDARSVLLITDDDSGAGRNFRIERPLAAGTYFIRVSGNTRTVTGAYTLNIAGASVTTVMLGSMTTGMLAAGGDDYFQFILESTQFLAIYSSGGTDVIGRLYDARSVLLVTDDDSGAGRNFRIDHLLTPGTYFIRVSGFESSSGNYTLHVETVDTTAITALTLPSMAGESTTSDQVSGANYFQLQIETAQTLTITSNSRNFGSLGSLRITIYDADFNILVNPGDSEDGSDFRTSREFTPGTYLLRVTGDSDTNYKVRISREGGEA